MACSCLIGIPLPKEASCPQSVCMRYVHIDDEDIDDDKDGKQSFANILYHIEHRDNSEYRTFFGFTTCIHYIYIPFHYSDDYGLTKCYVFLNKRV
jgi:hypothetical protein